MKSGGCSQAEALKGLIGWAAGGRLRQMSIILHQWCRRRGGSVTAGGGVDHLWHVYHVCSTWRIINFFHKVFKNLHFPPGFNVNCLFEATFVIYSTSLHQLFICKVAVCVSELESVSFFSPIRAWGCLPCFLLNCQKWTQFKAQVVVCFLQACLVYSKSSKGPFHSELHGRCEKRKIGK